MFSFFASKESNLWPFMDSTSSLKGQSYLEWTQLLISAFFCQLIGKQNVYMKLQLDQSIVLKFGHFLWTVCLILWIRWTVVCLDSTLKQRVSCIRCWFLQRTCSSHWALTSLLRNTLFAAITEVVWKQKPQGIKPNNAFVHFQVALSCFNFKAFTHGINIWKWILLECNWL